MNAAEMYRKVTDAIEKARKGGLPDWAEDPLLALLDELWAAMTPAEQAEFNRAPHRQVRVIERTVIKETVREVPVIRRYPVHPYWLDLGSGTMTGNTSRFRISCNDSSSEEG